MTYSDASRHKVIIQPRCKEYVKKQRAAGRSHAMSLDESSPESSNIPATDKDIPSTSTNRRYNNLAKFFKLDSKPSIAVVHSGRIEKPTAKLPVANIPPQAGMNYPPAPGAANTSNSGSVEITAAATREKIFTAAAGTQNSPYCSPSLPLLPSAQYPCTCCDPKCCSRCRLLELADRFVHRHRPHTTIDNTPLQFLYHRSQT
jgi:hypothetical protein